MYTRFGKRIFDGAIAFIALCILWPFLLVFWMLASIDTRSNGIFFQERIGQYGKVFVIYKIKTLNDSTKKGSSLGAFFRKTKLDELPQLFNIVLGQMSFVGPRPDIAGYYDTLQGEDRKILQLKPGLTSEAAIKYLNEEQLLAKQPHPLAYNDTVIFPDKVRMNLQYYETQSFLGDLKIIWRTLMLCK